MAERKRGAAWQLEGDFETSRGLVNVVERDSRYMIRMRLDADGTDTVVALVTPDQAGWLGVALPAALAMIHSREEQREWERALQDPFADFDRADRGGDETGDPPAPVPADPPSSAPVSGAVSDIEDAPVPPRRGQAWSADEEAQLVAAYQAGQGVEQLAAQLQRSPRAIAKRLEKLELVVAER